MKVELNKIYHADNAKFTPSIPDGFLDVILEDPPYLYLKNQKLDRPFDELAHFTECARMLKEGGFIVIFGRGASFYRWNTILDCMRLFNDEYVVVDKKVTDDDREYYNGEDITNDKRFKRVFNFKEEIIWDKMHLSSPLNAIMRVHETISIWVKGKGRINKIKVPIVEAYKFDPRKIIESIYRITTTFGNRETFELVKKYFETGEAEFNDGNVRKFNTTISSDISKRNRTLQFAVGLEEGITERTIIKEVREHYRAIHPTQKPPRLIERLLALVIPQNKPAGEIVVADFFGGSCNTAKACITMGVNYIVTEIDKEFYDKGVENVEQFKEGFQPSLFN